MAYRQNRIVAAKTVAGLLAVAVVMVWPLQTFAQVTEKVLASQRAQMVRTIESIATYSRGRSIPSKIDERVLRAMRQVPRHEFVPERERRFAYEDRPLSIGYGQTISQPFIVALMTDLLDLKPGDSVLEVGTGSGYQAAVLAALGIKVTTVEIVPQLSARAAQALKRTGFEDVDVIEGDGYDGWPAAAPYDGVVVTAAASHVPPPLIEQLRPGGRMVIPVGPAFLVQHLMLVTKDEDGKIRTRTLLPVSFVPLTGSGEE